MMARIDRNKVSHGFTLIEVLVAMLVTAVGLLGMAKMQALAVSATKESSNRSLIALQTGSLVSAMHANPAFWAGGLAPSLINASGGAVRAVGDLSTVVANCDTACAPLQMAAYDLQQWAINMNQQFPSSAAKIECTGAPVGCRIHVTWTERQLSVNKTTATGASQVTTESFSVFVKP